MNKLLLVLFLLYSQLLYAQTEKFNGLDMNLGNLSKISDAQTRSISPENFTGERSKGGMADPVRDKDKPNAASAANAARELGVGWKINPYITIKANETVTLAEIEGPGAIQHIWMTPTGNWRFSIVRFYWDDEKEASVEVPVGDFFCMGWGEFAQINSLPVTVNPGSAFNCYWKMPFRKKCKITMENINVEPMRLYYSVDYTLTTVGEEEGYFHAQYRQSDANSNAVYIILDNVKGKGHFVGVYMAWGVNNNGWWGEGEVKFYMDGDKDFATIVGTGTEDYFGGSYNFENKKTHQYQEFSTAYTGMPQVIRPDGVYKAQQGFGLYRWHIMDPVRFKSELKMTVQDLGWRSGGRYRQQKSDLSSVAYWYQREPHAPFPKVPTKDQLERL